MKVVAVIQARMGSTRLPGKVLMKLGGEPMLVRVVKRTARAEVIDQIVVAVPDSDENDVLVGQCEDMGVACYRGAEDDVLNRYYRASQEYEADVVVRVTSDCPLIEPEIINRVVVCLREDFEQLDYVSSFIPRRTFPQGLDAEAMKFSALEKAWLEDKNPAWREHVTEYILRNPLLFALQGVINDHDLSKMRWTVDTPEDLLFVRKIYDYFGQDNFSWYDVLDLLKEHPEWLEINRHVQQKTVE